MNSQKLPHLQSPRRAMSRARSKQIGLSLTIKDPILEASTFRTTTFSRQNINIPHSERLKTFSDVSYLNSRNISSKQISASTPKIPLSNIAKDPQLYEFFNQSNKKNIYASMLKDNVKGTFIEDPKELVKHEKTIDFSPLLQNIKIHQFRYYLSSILQQECKTIFDTKTPPNRQQAVDLLLWFEKMINNLQTNSLNLITDLTNQLQTVYQYCIYELARQISYECKERGTLLLIIWNSFAQFIEMLIQNVAFNFEEMETEQIETVSRIQKTQQTAVSQFQQEIENLKHKIEILENEKIDLNEKNILLAKKSLLLTNDIKMLGSQLEEMTDNHNKVYNELIQTKLNIENQTSQQTVQKIKIGIQEGQSVVAHLLSMKNTVFPKLQKKTSIQFEKVEQLKEDEEYFKSGLSKYDIDELNSTFHQQNLMKMQSKMAIPIIQEEKNVQTDSYLQSYIQEIFEKVLEKQRANSLMKQKELLVDQKELLIQIVQLFENNQCDSEKEIKNKFIEQMLEIQEQKVNARYYEQTLQEATQEFIELLKKKKQKIRQLKKSQTQLQNRLNSLQIESPPKELPTLQVNSPGAIKTPSFRNSLVLDQPDALKEEILESQEMSEEESILKNMEETEKELKENQQTETNVEREDQQNEQQERNEQLQYLDEKIERNFEQNQQQKDENNQGSQNIISDNNLKLQQEFEEKSRKQSKSSLSKQSGEENDPKDNNAQKRTSIQFKKNLKNKKSLIINSLSGIKDQDEEFRQNHQIKRKASKVVKFQQRSNHTITLDGSSEINDSDNISLESSSDEEKGKDDQGKIEKIKHLVQQYGGANIQKRRFTKPVQIKTSLLSDLKKERRVKRVYSQNTDAANSLLHDVMNIKQKKHKESIIPLTSIIKIFNTILSDTAKNPEGYKIPLHVSIYDFFLKKYGFKNVAEKKIKQLLQFIFYKKSLYPKLQLISRLCYMDDEMDEAVYKLVVESIKYFHSKEIQLNKPEINLTFEQLHDYCNEFLLKLLGQNYINQLNSQLKQNTQKVVIFEQVMVQVMNLYFQKKKQCEDSLKLIFQAADLDGNNLIEFSEFKNLYKAIHPNIYDKQTVLEQFISYADYIEELSKNKMITLPRFAEMALELNLFAKEQINQYSKGYEFLIQEWEEQKHMIKFRYLKAEKFPKVKFTYNLLTEQINILKKKEKTAHDPQTLWVSYKLLQEKSQRVVLNHEVKECFFDLIPQEFWIIQQGFRAIEELCI